MLLVLAFALPVMAKDRVIVLTDIENEPDDTQSMIRFLTYSNHWDVEALVATTSIHQRDKTAAASIRVLIEAYAKARENLLKHEPGYPTADYLLSVLREGRAAYGMNAVGQNMDSPGIEDANKVTAWFTAPKVTTPATMHVILAVTDQGTPALTRYQRVIVTIYP